MQGIKGINPRQMKQAMRKMGITSSSIDDAIEVVIKTSSKNIVISNPEVTVMTVQGINSYQITGNVSERGVDESLGAVDSIPSEDIDLVMSQTSCSREEAIEALKECDGQPAEAILKIMTR
ncbi:MAG: nascent polypeptide-associated complex protein [archaeon]|nr:nascent polypeptide-associated complex protein [archaeon]